MPMKKQYISRNGQIEYEIDEAGEILTYARDALGNVVAGYDKNTNAVFTIDYKPFGEFAATTGTITGRRFLWVGTWGYRFTPSVPVSHYIRARHLMMRMGMWTTVDPLWPSEMAYGYVRSHPIGHIDPFGNIAIPLVVPVIVLGVTSYCAALAYALFNHYAHGVLSYPYDKKGHCVANCLLSYLSGGVCGAIAIPATECIGEFDWDDLHANAVGFAIGTAALTGSIAMGVPLILITPRIFKGFEPAITSICDSGCSMVFPGPVIHPW